MAEKTPGKYKLYEFRSLSQVVAVVATDLETATKTMLDHGYEINLPGNSAGFWLERVYDKTFDQIIVADKAEEESPGQPTEIEKVIIDRLEEYRGADEKARLQTQTLERFAFLLYQVREEIEGYTPKRQNNIMMISRYIKTTLANVFPVNWEQVMALPQYQKLEALCQSIGCLLEIELMNEPLTNEGLIYQIFHIRIGKKTEPVSGSEPAAEQGRGVILK
ncbi:MAG: hypothetical protein WC473_05165 [Patescibacteria group bacterium]